MPIWLLEELDGVDLDQWATSRGDRHFRDIDCRGFVVTAVDEAEARRLACEEDRAGCQGTVCERWLDAQVISCVPVTDERSRVIMANWPSGWDGLSFIAASCWGFRGTKFMER